VGTPFVLALPRVTDREAGASILAFPGGRLGMSEKDGNPQSRKRTRQCRVPTSIYNLGRDTALPCPGYKISDRSKPTEMETITIQVDAELAQAYRSAKPQQQQNATFMFNLIIKELLNSNSFTALVEQIRAETAANGLTAEILAELLEDE